MKKNILTAVIFISVAGLTGCSTSGTKTPSEDSTYRPTPTTISAVFAKGTEPITGPAAICMGGVIFDSEMSDSGVEKFIKWDGKSSTGLTPADAEILGSTEIGVKMTGCLAVVSGPQSPPGSEKPQKK